MNRLGLIIYREWITRVRRRAFIIGTLLVPVLLALGVGFGAWMENAEMEENKVLVVDLSGMITFWDDTRQAYLPICPECFPEREHLEYRFADQALDDADFLLSDFTSMVLLDDAILQHGQAKNLYEKSPSLTAQSAIERDLSSAIERFKVKEELSLDYEAYKRLKTKISLVGEDIITKDGNATGRSIIGFVFSLFMFIQIMVYGMHVMRGVIEEKSNRIVEVVLSTVRPSQLLAGKIAGIGLVGLTQILGWAVLSWGLFFVFGLALDQSAWMEGWAQTQGLAPEAVDLTTVMASQSELAFLLDINWGVMLTCGALYFVLGYALYSAFFATIGAMVEQESDAQYLLLPVMAPLLFSYMLASMSLDSPESTLAIVSSFVPFSAPISMMVRLPMGVPWWHVALSMALLLATTVALVGLAGRVYRVAILMYGKKPNMKEVVRWMFHPDSGAL